MDGPTKLWGPLVHSLSSDFAGLASCTAWHFLVDANGVFAVIPLYDQDSVPAFKSGWNESADGTVNHLVSAFWLFHSDDFKGKRKRRAWE